VKHLSSTNGIAGVTAMLVALIAWPAAAANTLSSDDFLAMTNSQAEQTDMPGFVQRQQDQPAAAVATTSNQPAAAVTSKNESTEIKAARLGVMTPYGKRALVQELRNYYPGSYRDFRSLNTDQVNELVVLFEQTGNLNQVLAHMDTMSIN